MTEERGKVIKFGDSERPLAEVEIPQAIVSVATVTVNSKRLTKSLFRQVVTEPIYEWDNEVLKGSGIGWVNDQIESGPEKTIHLLWQRGGNLRRCYVDRTANYWRVDNRETFLDDVIRKSTDYGGLIRVSIHGYLRTPTGRWRPHVDSDPIDFDLPRESFAYRATDDEMNMWRQRHDERKQKIEAAASRHIAEFKARFVQLIDRWERAYDRYEAAVSPLFKLPQLYLG